MTLTSFYDCYTYLKGRMEKCGYDVDFIQNPVTMNTFVTVNGYRAQVKGCGAATPITEVYSNLLGAFKNAWEQAEKKGADK